MIHLKICLGRGGPSLKPLLEVDTPGHADKPRSLHIDERWDKKCLGVDGMMIPISIYRTDPFFLVNGKMLNLGVRRMVWGGTEVSLFIIQSQIYMQARAP